jgi:hypothetical protein
VRTLAYLAPELSEDDILFAIGLESRTRRRKSILTALIRLAGQVHKKAFIEALKKKYGI